MAMSGHVWPCLAMSGHVWSCLATQVRSGQGLIIDDR